METTLKTSVQIKKNSCVFHFYDLSSPSLGHEENILCATKGTIMHVLGDECDVQTVLIVNRDFFLFQRKKNVRIHYSTSHLIKVFNIMLFFFYILFFIFTWYRWILRIFCSVQFSLSAQNQTVYRHALNTPHTCR